VLALEMLQVFYYSTLLFISSGLTEESAKFATIGIGAIMVGMTLVSIPLMDRTGRRTLHLYGLGGMFIFSIFITISFLIKVCNKDFHNTHASDVRMLSFVLIIPWVQCDGGGVLRGAVFGLPTELRWLEGVQGLVALFVLGQKVSLGYCEIFRIYITVTFRTLKTHISTSLNLKTCSGEALMDTNMAYCKQMKVQAFVILSVRP
jgi:hypothetical protein